MKRKAVMKRKATNEAPKARNMIARGKRRTM